MSDIQKILLGAVMAIAGGILGKVFAAFYDEWRERKFIKRALCDELSEMESIISRFDETYQSSNQLVPSYLTQLKANTDAYNAHRNRLFLLSSEKTRTEIIKLYRDLIRNIDEHEGKLGKLSTIHGKTTEQNDIIAAFKGIKTRAETTKTKLNSWF
ncbi:MAG: MCP four helix bundle domain-containing protein [Chitinophagales bacterium]